jgi:hypothetical protein
LRVYVRLGLISGPFGCSDIYKGENDK